MVANTKPNLLELEVLRLKRKGFKNNAIALTLFLAFFIVSHAIGKWAWEKYIHLPVSPTFRTWFITIGVSVGHTATAIFCFLICLPLYLGIPSWLDKYRIEVRTYTNVGQPPVALEASWMGSSTKQNYWPSHARPLCVRSSKHLLGVRPHKSSDGELSFSVKKFITQHRDYSSRTVPPVC